MAQLNTKILLRSDTSENWSNAEVAGQGANAVLLKGEMGVELLADGVTKIKIGDGTKTWAQLPYFVGELPEIPSANVYEVESYEALPTNGVAKGDTGIVKVLIHEDAEDATKNKYSYTGYVYGESGWVAMDGNYNADNVILTGNVQLSGDYTKVGNIEKASTAAVSTYDWDGLSVRQMFEQILSKVLYPTKPSPSISKFTLNNAGAKEIGSTITPEFKVKYDPKTYAYGSVKNNTANSGTYAAATNAVITLGDGSTIEGTIGGDGSAAKEVSIKGTEMVVTGSTSYYGSEVVVTYGQGAVPYTNTKVEYAASQVAAGSCNYTTDTSKITSYREGCFYGTIEDADFDPTADLNSALIRGLQNKLGAGYSSNTAKTFTVDAGSTHIIIACPKSDSYAPSSVFNNSVFAEMWSDANFVKYETQVGGADATASSLGEYATAYNVWIYKPANAYSSSASITITLK